MTSPEPATNLLGTENSKSEEIDTLAEDYVATELEEKFDALSNEFCENVREESSLNGSSAH